MGKSTLDMVAKILAEDKTASKKQSEKGGYDVMPSSSRLEIKKADAGGMIVCWYGPNGSREVIVKDAAEAVSVVEEYFKD